MIWTGLGLSTHNLPVAVFQTPIRFTWWAFFILSMRKRSKPKTLNFTRSAVISDRSAVDQEARTVRVAFATETPCPRYFGTEILTCTPEAVNLERLNAGGAVCWNHNSWGRPIGVVVKAWVDDDRICRAIVQWGESPEAISLWPDVVSGVIRNVSVGYTYRDDKLEPVAGEKGVYRVLEWEPIEISFCPIQADPNSQVGRSMAKRAKKKTEAEIEDQKMDDSEEDRLMDDDEEPDPEDPIEDEESEEDEADTKRSASRQAREDRVLTGVVKVTRYAKALGIKSNLVNDYALAAREIPTIDGFRAFMRKQHKSGPVITVHPDEREPVIEVMGARSNIFKDSRKAVALGHFYAAVFGNERARQFCLERSMWQRDQTTDLGEQGGYLIPTQFLPEVINLQNTFGVALQNARVLPMTSNEMEIPELVEGFKFTSSKEMQAAILSGLKFGLIKLKPEKFSGYAKLSREVTTDSAIVLADLMTMEIARAGAFKIDECFFLGDGTSDFNGILGLLTRLRNPNYEATNPTITYVKGLVVGSGNKWDELVLLDFQKVLGVCPTFAKQGSKWYVSPSFFETVMNREVYKVGGVLKEDVINGNIVRRFLSYPVVEVEVMPDTEANSQVCAVFGNLMLGSYIGQKQQLAIETSDHVAFLETARVMRADIRFDVKHFGVGKASSTASQRKAGPIVGLITAAS